MKYLYHIIISKRIIFHYSNDLSLNGRFKTILYLILNINYVQMQITISTAIKFPITHFRLQLTAKNKMFRLRSTRHNAS